jgi:hypothetical protein
LQELRFRQMDADGDGKLTKEEVDKSREGFGRGGMQRGGRGGGGKDGNL